MRSTSGARGRGSGGYLKLGCTHWSCSAAGRVPFWRSVGLRHKCSKGSYQVVFWLIVLAYQFAAFDSLQNWQLSRAALARLEATFGAPEMTAKGES